MRVVISGYYGFGNLGDEAVLAAMLAALRPRLPHASFVVLSADPAATTRQHGVDAVSRLGPAALRALTGADVFLSGGGSLIQDVTSIRSALYYLGMLRSARFLAKRTMVYAQGIGPLRRQWIRTLTGRICDRADVLAVRDEESRLLLQSCGVRRSIEVVADPAFALPAAPRARAVELLGPRMRPRIGVALRPWAADRYVDPLLSAVRALCDHAGADAVILVFHPRKDDALSARAARELSADVISAVTPQEMLAVIGELDLVIGARLHALVCAAAAGVATVAVGYDPKVEALQRALGTGTLLPADTLTAEIAAAALTAAWAAREETARVLRTRAGTLRAAALRAADLAAAMAGFLFQPTE